MPVVFGAAALAFWQWPRAWLVALPALLPIIDLAPWTGWITFEEFDLLVLAAAAGGHARLAGSAGARTTPAASPLLGVAIVLFAASTVWAMWRAFGDAGGFAFGWFAGYREPMNGVRLVKCFLEAWLLLPIWREAVRRDGDVAGARLALGLVLGLATVSLAALWERLAFPGLLNFSTDYRTTALFWEMHVGGAALDGFLALTLPFALHATLGARSTRDWLAAAAIAVLGCYACLTTFSRGVYLGVVVGAAVTAGLHAWRSAAAPGTSPRPVMRDALVGGAWVAGFAATAAWLFPTSGYRGMLAALGAAAAVLPLAGALRAAPRAAWSAGLLLGAALAAGVAALAWAVPKGAYGAYAAALALTIGALAWRRAGRGPSTSPMPALGGFVATLAGVVAVAAHWGGAAALDRAWPVAAALLAIVLAASRLKAAPWPVGRRWQAGTAGAMALAGGVVAMLLGGSYLTERFATSSDDLGGRRAHWQQGLQMLRMPTDWALGKGLGRYFDNFWLNAPAQQRPGDYRVHEADGNAYLTLVAGTHVMGWGELLRVAQRVEPPTGPATLRVDLRSRVPVIVHVDLCLKHLLYDEGCLVKQIKLPAASGWQPLRLVLDGAPLGRGAWYAPRLAALSVSTETADVRVDVDNLSLTGADGRELLANGDFDRGMARWFFTSDRHHLPWHMKNMPLHVLFEQGAIGLALWSALVLGALWRVAFGAARHDPLAPALAGAFTAFIVVGLFDSLLDVPRLAMLFYLLVLVALTLRPAAAAVPRPAAAISGGVRGAPRAGTLAGVVAALVLAAGAVPEADAADAAASTSVPLIRVGPTRVVKTIADAARLAPDGATVLVDAGTYRADVASWAQNRLTVRAVGGRVRLLADGAAAEAKAIWVTRGSAMTVEGFDFEGAAVADRNGAGIRLERGSLKVVDCTFLRNEMGLLTSNDPSVALEVVDSEFAHNARADGHNHQLYVGAIGALRVTGSHFHDGFVGHLLKSRAAFNHIAHNRLADGAQGRASYELEFPNGGVAEVFDNLIQQGPLTENLHLVSFGAEGYAGTTNELILERNTLIDDRPRPGVFVRVRPGASRVRIVDNVFVGAAGMDLPPSAEVRGNVGLADRRAAGRVDPRQRAPSSH